MHLPQAEEVAEEEVAEEEVVEVEEAVEGEDNPQQKVEEEDK